MDSGTYKSDDRIYELIGDISKFTCMALIKESDTMGLAQSYRAIMFYLAKGDGVTQLELSRMTGLKPPTISVSLQKMENDGLVCRTDDKDDLRKTIVTLSDKGRAVVQQVTATLMDCDKAICESLTQDEITQLKALLTKVKAKIFAESEDEAKK